MGMPGPARKPYCAATLRMVDAAEGAHHARLAANRPTLQHTDPAIKSLLLCGQTLQLRLLSLHSELQPRVAGSICESRGQLNLAWRTCAMCTIAHHVCKIMQGFVSAAARCTGALDHDKYKQRSARALSSALERAPETASLLAISMPSSDKSHLWRLWIGPQRFLCLSSGRR